MAGQPVDLGSLSVDQLNNIKEQLESELKYACTCGSYPPASVHYASAPPIGMQSAHARLAPSIWCDAGT
jgi:hypothetical protein